MLREVEEYRQGAISFANLVNDLQALLDAAEFKDPALVHTWYDHWTPLEVRNAAGVPVDREKALSEVEAMSQFSVGLHHHPGVQSLLTRGQGLHRAHAD